VASTARIRARQPPDALVDLVRRHAGVGQAQRVAPALEQEVRALDEGHALVLGLVEDAVDVDLLGQLDPHEVAALRRLVARLRQLAGQRLGEHADALGQCALDRGDRPVECPETQNSWTIAWATMFGEM
jgi:hypothetical protein